LTKVIDIRKAVGFSKIDGLDGAGGIARLRRMIRLHVLRP
jgi:hypothetical protein